MWLFHHRDHIALRDALELSPWDKWRVHKIFPWKMVLHLLLVVTITAQVSFFSRLPPPQVTLTHCEVKIHAYHQINVCVGTLLVGIQAYMTNQHYAAYSRAVGRNFLNLFYPSAAATNTVMDYNYRIFTINETITDANHLLTTYFTVRSQKESMLPL